MDISLINSQSLVRLLSLVERKEELLQIVAETDAAIIETLKGGVSVEVVEISSVPAKPAMAQAKPAEATTKPAKAPTAKRKISPAARAKMAAAAKSRWAAFRAANK